MDDLIDLFDPLISTTMTVTVADELKAAKEQHTATFKSLRRAATALNIATTSGQSITIDCLKKLELAWSEFLLEHSELVDFIADNAGKLDNLPTVVDGKTMEQYKEAAQKIYDQSLSEYRQAILVPKSDHESQSNLGFMSSSLTQTPTPDSSYLRSTYAQQDLPSWDGKAGRSWLEFKVSWLTEVVPLYKNRQLALARLLRTQIRGDGKKEIEHVSLSDPQCYDTMWNTLVARYDNVALNVYVVLSIFENLKPCTEDNFQGVLDFIRKINAAHSQLKSLNQVNEVDMVRVSRISVLLPRSLHIKWAQVLSTLDDTQKYHPFDQFKEFLDTQTATIESLLDMSHTSKLFDSLHNSHSRKLSVRTHATGAHESPSKCVLHPTGAHLTKDCRQFLKMSVRDRFNLCSKHNLCKRCIDPKHGTCNQRCSYCNGESATTHHKLLCFAEHDSQGKHYQVSRSYNSPEVKVSQPPPMSSHMEQVVDSATGTVYQLTPVTYPHAVSGHNLISKPPDQNHVYHGHGANLTQLQAHPGQTAITSTSGTVIPTPTVAAATTAHASFNAGTHAAPPGRAADVHGQTSGPVVSQQSALSHIGTELPPNVYTKGTGTSQMFIQDPRLLITQPPAKGIKPVSPHNVSMRTNIFQTHCSKKKEQIVADSQTFREHLYGLYAIFTCPIAYVLSKLYAIIFCDSGSDCSLITEKGAMDLGARTIKEGFMDMTTLHGTKTVPTRIVEVPLQLPDGRVFPIVCYTMPELCGTPDQVNEEALAELFPKFDPTVLQRPKAAVNILLSADYFQLHPKRELAVAGNLSVMESVLGICLQGSHPRISELGASSPNPYHSTKLTFRENYYSTVSFRPGIPNNTTLKFSSCSLPFLGPATQNGPKAEEQLLSPSHAEIYPLYPPISKISIFEAPSAATHVATVHAESTETPPQFSVASSPPRSLIERYDLGVQSQNAATMLGTRGSRSPAIADVKLVQSGITGISGPCKVGIGPHGYSSSPPEKIPNVEHGPSLRRHVVVGPEVGSPRSRRSCYDDANGSCVQQGSFYTPPEDVTPLARSVCPWQPCEVGNHVDGVLADCSLSSESPQSPSNESAGADVPTTYPLRGIVAHTAPEQPGNFPTHCEPPTICVETYAVVPDYVSIPLNRSDVTLANEHGDEVNTTPSSFRTIHRTVPTVPPEKPDVNQGHLFPDVYVISEDKQEPSISKSCSSNVTVLCERSVDSSVPKLDNDLISFSAETTDILQGTLDLCFVYNVLPLISSDPMHAGEYGQNHLPLIPDDSYKSNASVQCGLDSCSDYPDCKVPDNSFSADGTVHSSCLSYDSEVPDSSCSVDGNNTSVCIDSTSCSSCHSSQSSVVSVTPLLSQVDRLHSVYPVRQPVQDKSAKMCKSAELIFSPSMFCTELICSINKNETSRDSQSIHLSEKTNSEKHSVSRLLFSPLGTNESTLHFRFSGDRSTDHEDTRFIINKNDFHSGSLFVCSSSQHSSNPPGLRESVYSYSEDPCRIPSHLSLKDTHLCMNHIQPSKDLCVLTYHELHSTVVDFYLVFLTVCLLIFSISRLYGHSVGNVSLIYSTSLVDKLSIKYHLSYYSLIGSMCVMLYFYEVSRSIICSLAVFSLIHSGYITICVSLSHVLCFYFQTSSFLIGRSSSISLDGYQETPLSSLHGSRLSPHEPLRVSSLESLRVSSHESPRVSHSSPHESPSKSLHESPLSLYESLRDPLFESPRDSSVESPRVSPLECPRASSFESPRVSSLESLRVSAVRELVLWSWTQSSQLLVA